MHAELGIHHIGESVDGRAGEVIVGVQIVNENEFRIFGVLAAPELHVVPLTVGEGADFGARTRVNRVGEVIGGHAVILGVQPLDDARGNLRLGLIGGFCAVGCEFTQPPAAILRIGQENGDVAHPPPD